MDPAAGLGMPPLPAPSSAAPAEPPAASEGAEGQQQRAFLTGWQQQGPAGGAAEASQGELAFRGPGEPGSAGSGRPALQEGHDPRSGGGAAPEGLGSGRRRTARPRKTTRRSEFVDSRAAVQDNDPDYELDEDEDAEEPPDDSDDDMDDAPRRRYASAGAGSGGGSGSGGTGKGGRPTSAGRSGGSGSEDEEEGRGGRKTNRRVIANRQSAQRSRMRKLQYISDLEANVAGLQNDLNEMQPQVALVQSRHASMTQQNEQLRMQVAALLQETQYKDSLNEALRGELSLLQQHAAAQGLAGGGQGGGGNGAAGGAHGPSGTGFQGFQSAALGLHGAQQPQQATQQQQQSLLQGFGGLQGFGASGGAPNGPPMAQSSETGLLPGQGGGLGEYLDPSLYQLAGLVGSGAGGSASAAGRHLHRPAATSGSPAL